MISERQRQLDAIIANLPAVPAHHHEGHCECPPTVFYIRVSSIKKRQKIVSPDVQLKESMPYVVRNNLKIIAIEHDIDKSGQSMERPGLQRVVEKISSGEYERLTLWKWSRWGRTLRESLNMLSQVEEAGGIVESATEPYDQDSVWGEVGRNQTLLYADVQGKLIGENWRGVLNHRRSLDLPHSGRARFGYDYVEVAPQRREYVVNEIQKPLLRRAYLDYVAGKSASRIATMLNDAGERTTMGGRWTPQGVTRMLDTGFAAGLIRERKQPRRRRQAAVPANKLSDYDVWRKGKHKPIITMATWEKYRARRLAQAELPPRSRRAVHPVSALLFCELCARRLTTKYAGSGRNHQWQCSWQMTYHPGRPVSVSNAGVTSLVKGWLAERSQPDWVDELARRTLEESRRVVEDREDVQAQLARLEKAIRKLIRAFAMSDDEGDADVQAELDRLRTEKRALSERLAAPTQQAPPVPDYRAFGALTERWDSFEPAVLREALSKVVGMIVVSPLAAPPARGEVADRVEIVPAWLMHTRASWLAERRRLSA